KLVVSSDGGRLLGGVLVGDASPYQVLLAATREGRELPARPHGLLFGAAGGAAGDPLAGFGEDSQICSCNNVTKGQICSAIREHELATVSGVKACTRAGTGCGGCVPLVAEILDAALASAGRPIH